MRSSDEVRARAELTILRIARLLDEKRLDELVHDPIDHATASFQPEADPITDWRQFHSEIAAFLGHLHRGGIPALRPVLRPLDHAIALLDQHYVGPYASGYHAALLDAIDPERGGIEPVLIRIAEILKQQMSADYVRWVFLHHLDPSDWATRCQIARILLERCRNYLPANVLRCSPSQLVDTLPQLFELAFAPPSLPYDDTSGPMQSPGARG